MAIKKSTEKHENKFENAVAELDEQENLEKEKSDKVVKQIAGNGSKTRTIEVKSKDGTIRTREIKVTEKRKTLPVYIPESMYEQFDAINTAYGKSNNSAIVELIRDYITEKKSILNEV
ncbi:MAG: hypothetical protein PUG48_00760 [Clostridia bacterium]|nr:hypothetical protein [Clostridia bacterium]